MKKDYKKMSYENLQKEVFLLEHGFYDETVARYVEDNKSLFFQTEALDYPFRIALEHGNKGYYLFPSKHDIEIPCDVWTGILLCSMGYLLERARKKWFKSMYHIEVKDD